MTGVTPGGAEARVEWAGEDLPSTGTRRQPTGRLDVVEDSSLAVLAAQAGVALSASPFDCLAMATAVVASRYSTADPLAVRLESAGRRLLWSPPTSKGVSVAEILASLDEASPGTDGDARIGMVDGGRIPTGTAGVGLTVGLQGERVWIGFDDGIVTRQAVDRFIGHLGVVLAAAARAPDGCPSDWEILTPREVAGSESWNDTAAGYDLERTFLERFLHQAGLTPEAIAAEQAGREMTYAELDAAANRVAGHLTRVGMGAETVVGLMLERGLDALVAVVAVFKCGAAYFPMDHANPAHRTGSALRRGAPDLCLVHESLKGMFESAQAASGQTYPLALFEEALAAEREPVRGAPRPDHLAYVLSTSGSTGTPKAAMIEQGGMLNHSLAMIDLLDLGTADVMAQNAPLTFDISVWQMITPLLVGARVSFVPDEALGAPDRLLEWAHLKRVTHLQIVPSLMTSILRLTAYDEGISLPDSLRWVIPTGEALPVDTARRWLERFPGPPLLNAYGPAECSDDVTVQVITHPPRSDLLSMPIGRPLPNVTAYVLDRHDKRAPIGAVGEICVGGVGVGRGYRNDPERTASSFDANPFPPHGRLYRTGDMGRFLEDGSLQYVGRTDHQVKIGGIRIELGEVEAALTDHPQVTEAVAMARGSQLVAYVTTRSDRPVRRDDLRAFLADRLPGYMIPQAFVHLTRLPLNRNGKVDRRQLPEPSASDLGVTSPSGEATTETQRKLIDIWGDLLQSPVGLDDDFFALGGTSLVAAVMLWRVRKELSADLPISTPARAPTVRQLARLIDGDAGPDPALVPLRAGGDRTPLFLAPGQGGSTLGFVKLARHLEGDRPVWGLDLQRRRDEPAEPQTFEKLVDRYLAAMRSVQPQGPYLVGGWCLGGEVAFEIAQRLRDEGEEAALVVLLQTDSVTYPRYRVGLLRRAWSATLDRLSYEKEMMALLPGAARLPYIRDEIVGRALIRLRLPLEALLAACLSRLGIGYRGSDEYHQRRWYRADGAAYTGHTFDPYPGDVIQIRAHHQPRGIVPDPTLGWGDLVTGRLDTVEVDGYHWSFLREPIVRQVAQRLTRALDEIDGSETGGEAAGDGDPT